MRYAGARSDIEGPARLEGCGYPRRFVEDSWQTQLWQTVHQLSWTAQ
jgi:hypothetical protein